MMEEKMQVQLDASEYTHKELLKENYELKKCLVGVRDHLLMILENSRLLDVDIFCRLSTELDNIDFILYGD